MFLLQDWGTYSSKCLECWLLRAYRWGSQEFLWNKESCLTQEYTLFLRGILYLVMGPGRSKRSSHPATVGGIVTGHPSSRAPLGWVQFSSVAQSCPTLRNTMNCSTPGLPVHHQLLEFTQTHLHWIGDAIQPSHPLLSPSPAFNLSQHWGLFKSGVESIGISVSISILSMNTQDWFPLGWTDWISLQSKGLSWVFSNTTVQKHQFFGAQLSL